MGGGDGYVLERWEYTGHVGDRVAVEATLPRGEHTGAVLIVHGATGGKDSPYVRAAARSLARAGLAAFAPDLPGHGERGRGQPAGGLTDEALQRILGDLLRLVSTIRVLVPDRRTPLGYLGFSMGVVVGVPFLAVQGDVRSAVLVVGGATSRLDLGPGAPDPIAHAPRVEATDVLMMQADQDEVFDRAAAFELYDAFTCPKQIVFFPGTHDSWRQAATRYRTIVAHLRGRLGGGP